VPRNARDRFGSYIGIHVKYCRGSCARLSIGVAPQRGCESGQRVLHDCDVPVCQRDASKAQHAKKFSRRHRYGTGLGG
jgi:hypothetical protein